MVYYMTEPKYSEVTVSNKYHVYEFASIGTKGIFIKKIQFIETENPNIVNLAFGDKLEDGSIDDNIETNNGDRDKILATVAGSVYQYTAIYPNKHIIFFGSNKVRTRLYRMAISHNFEFLNPDFHIFALIEHGDILVSVPFEKGIDCVGFLVKKKV